MKRRLSMTLPLLAVAGIAGCQPQYDGLRMKVLAGGGDALGRTITVEQGRAMLIEVRPESSNPFEDYEKFNLVELDSYNDTIARIFPADDVNRFVIVGAGLGRVAVDVIIDDRTEDTIEAEVVPQQGDF